jgi:hypothetical protein
MDSKTKEPTNAKKGRAYSPSFGKGCPNVGWIIKRMNQPMQRKEEPIPLPLERDFSM